MWHHELCRSDYIIRSKHHMMCICHFVLGSKRNVTLFFHMFTCLIRKKHVFMFYGAAITPTSYISVLSNVNLLPPLSLLNWWRQRRLFCPWWMCQIRLPNPQFMSMQIYGHVYLLVTLCVLFSYFFRANDYIVDFGTAAKYGSIVAHFMLNLMW